MSMRDKGGDTPPLLLGRNCRLRLERPLIMGILNVTPDSFYDGGRYAAMEDVLRRSEQMLDEGADLIDVGGESTRPGAAEISLQQELDRVIPVVEALARRVDLPVSVDTSKSQVARAAVEAGAEFVNDISGLAFDAEMAGVVAETGAGLFVMHTRGRPDRMQDDTDYADLMAEVIAGLRQSVELAVKSGVEPSRIAVDPGIGFGKSAEGNLEILRRLNELQTLGRPVLLGTSRKSFISTVLGHQGPEQRLSGSLATIALGVTAGAMLFRVHDVAASRDAARMAWAVVRGDAPIL